MKSDETFDVAGKVVTTDALLTQRLFSEAACSEGGEYLLRVKKKQAALSEEIECLFRWEPETDFQTAYKILKCEHQEHGDSLDTYETSEIRHGRVETRRLTSSTKLNTYVNWPDVGPVFEYTSKRKDRHTGIVETQTQYGITSLSPKRANAKKLLAYKRGHWRIENQSHWITRCCFWRGCFSSPV